MPDRLIKIKEVLKVRDLCFCKGIWKVTDAEQDSKLSDMFASCITVWEGVTESLRAPLCSASTACFTWIGRVMLLFPCLSRNNSIASLLLLNADSLHGVVIAGTSSIWKCSFLTLKICSKIWYSLRCWKCKPLSDLEQPNAGLLMPFLASLRRCWKEKRIRKIT